MGAWIETSLSLGNHNINKSLPMWERGLKHMSIFGGILGAGVAPHVGAWIETGIDTMLLTYDASLPMWERGLKLLRGVTQLLKEGRSPCGSVD